MPGPLHVKKCKHCGKEFDYQYHHATQELYCPFCFAEVESLSEFGFGPVWPAYFFIGNKEIAAINEFGKYPDLEFVLEIYGYGEFALETGGETGFLKVMAAGRQIVQGYVGKHG